MSRNRDFYTDILNAERAEDATEDFDYDTYDDLSDDDLINKIKSDHGYEDGELDDMYNKWDSDDSDKEVSNSIDVDGDGNTDLKTMDVDDDGDIDIVKINDGKGSKTADEYADALLSNDDEWEDVKNALTSIKY